MECKEGDKGSDATVPIVLIETLWNVKNNIVLPDPLPVLSINRNIMECKGG